MASQDKPHKEVPLLIKTSTSQSWVACLFLQSFAALHVQGTVSDNTQEALGEVSNQQLLCLYGFPSRAGCLKSLKFFIIT